MKALTYTSLIAVLAALTIIGIGMVTTTMIKTQQASAQATGWNPPEDAQKRFKEISNGLERAVSDEIGTKDTAKVDAAFGDYCTQLFDIFDFDFKCSAGFHNPHN